MHHKLDIQPVPERVLYINEMDFLSPDFYGTDAEYEKALTGIRQSEGGILPDDNVRIYAPMDLNSDYIIQRLHMLEATLGNPDESNESWYLTGMQKVMVQLEVYDQVWAARDLAHAVQKVPGKTIIANRESIWRPGSLNVLKWQERIARQNVILLK